MNLANYPGYNHSSKSLIISHFYVIVVYTCLTMSKCELICTSFKSSYTNKNIVRLKEPRNLRYYKQNPSINLIYVCLNVALSQFFTASNKTFRRIPPTFRSMSFPGNKTHHFHNSLPKALTKQISSTTRWAQTPALITPVLL